MKPNLNLQLPLPIEVAGCILQAVPPQSSMAASDENSQVRIYFDPARVPEGERIVAGGVSEFHDVRRCRVCGCTDDDCRQCIEKTGVPCHWVEADLCSACASAHRHIVALPPYSESEGGGAVSTSTDQGLTKSEARKTFARIERLRSPDEMRDTEDELGAEEIERLRKQIERMERERFEWQHAAHRKEREIQQLLRERDQLIDTAIHAALSQVSSLLTIGGVDAWAVHEAAKRQVRERIERERRRAAG